MIDFVIDHMENAGVVFASRNELASVTEGVFFSFILSFNVYRKTFFTLPLPEFLLML